MIYIACLRAFNLNVTFLAAQFHVVHQSPERVTLPSVTAKAIPLYCVAGGHRWDYKYIWTLGGNPFGPESPVIWTTKPGLYRCVVHHDMLQEQCSSHLIQVTLPEADVLVCNCVGTKHYVMGICTFLSLGVITPLADPQTHASDSVQTSTIGSVSAGEQAPQENISATPGNLSVWS